MLAPFGKSLRDAVDFYLPHLKATQRTCSLPCLVEELIAIKQKDGASQRYLSDLHSRLVRFAAGMGEKHVSDITSTEVDEWLRALDGGPTSRNNTRRILIVAFNFAVERGYCVSNPAVKTAKAKEIEGTVGILSIEQTIALLHAAPVALLPFIAIGAFAGLRHAELTRLDWAEIDLHGELIEVTAKKAKSARRRLVKIRPNLKQWLQPITKKTGPVTPSNYRDLMEKARKEAEIKEWPNNALRHGFASYNLAHFNDAAALALELGHTNANLVFQHYRQVLKPAEVEKYWGIVPPEQEESIAAFN